MNLWSKNPTEQQILQVFHTPMTFKIMRLLMEDNLTIAEIAKKLNNRTFSQIYPAIRHLRRHGLIKLKEYKLTAPYSKVGVFMPTVKSITIHISKETEIKTETKLILHNKDFELEQVDES